MSGNRLLTAIVVLVGLLALTIWQFNKREADDTKPPEIVAKLPKAKKDDVDELSVGLPGKAVITVKKTDGVWKLTAPIAADADKDAIENALGKLDELEAVAIAATKPENHEKLEVTEAKAIRVTAKKAGSVLADVWIGSYLSGHTMVREQGQVTVVTARGSIKYAFDKNLNEWRDKVLVEAKAEEATAATFTNKNGVWKFVKEGADWKQAPGEKPIAQFDGTKVGSLVGTLTSLRANDFATDDVSAETAGVAPTPNGVITLDLSSDAGASQILVRIGNKKASGYYAVREGKAPIFIISEYTAERLLPAADKFAKDEPKAAAAKPGPGPGLAEAMKGHGHP